MCVLGTYQIEIKKKGLSIRIKFLFPRKILNFNRDGFRILIHGIACHNSSHTIKIHLIIMSAFFYLQILLFLERSKCNKFKIYEKNNF